MEINKWGNNFMISLRRTFKTDELSFVHNKATNKFGVACNSRDFVNYSTPFFIFDSEKRYNGEFEKLLNAHWVLSPIHIWATIEMYHVDNVMYFAKFVDLTTHICNQYCISSAKYLSDKIFVEDSICKQGKDNFVRVPSVLDVKISNEHVRVLLEFDREDGYDLSNSSRLSLIFKKLSPNAKATVRATEGSVEYDLLSAVFKTIEPQECDVVPSDIVLIAPPAVYPRIAPRSSLAIKNTDVGAGIVDIDYRGNVIIMNHSKENHLHIEPGDKIGQFVLTRYETPEVVEVSHLDSTERGDKGFGSSRN